MSGTTFGAALKMLQQPTPAAPPASTDQVYFKSDGFPYYMGPDGIEHPFIAPNPSLHGNPTFDIVSAGKPTLWDDSQMSGGGALSSDTTAANVISGASAKIHYLNGAGTRLLTTNAFPVNDQQTIQVTFWTKYAGSNIVLPVELITNTTANGANLFQPGAIVNGIQVTPLTTWAKYTVNLPIPAGHLWARLSFNPFSIAPTYSGDLWLDESYSAAINNPPASTVPIGATIQYGSSSAPSGYLLCDGSIKNISDYPSLAAIYGTNYGGNGTTTFGLPYLEPIPQDRLASQITSAEVIASSNAGWTLAFNSGVIRRGWIQLILTATRTGATITLNNPNHAAQAVGTLTTNYSPANGIAGSCHAMPRWPILAGTGVVSFAAGLMSAVQTSTKADIISGDSSAITFSYPVNPSATFPRTYTIVRAL
jgi:microcystin-dependent protein